MRIVKKILFAAYQILRSCLLVVRKRAEWSWSQSIGDWPEDLMRRKFWLSAVTKVEIEKIDVVFNGEKFRLRDSPQKEYFSELMQGCESENTRYFSQCQQIYSPDTLLHLFMRRFRLHQVFQESEKQNMPVVVCTQGDRFLVEDGAHRLALQAARGAHVALVGITFWSKIPQNSSGTT